MKRRTVLSSCQLFTACCKMCTCFCAYAKKGYKAAALTINTQILSIGNITKKEYVQKLFGLNILTDGTNVLVCSQRKKNQLTKLQLVDEFLSQINEVV